MNHAVLDPALAAALHDIARGAPASRGRQPPGIALLAPKRRHPPRAVVFVELHEGGDLGPVPGVEPNAPGSGGIRTAVVALDAVDGLSSEPGVRRIVAARRLRPHMDVAAGRVGVPALRTRTGLEGRGVVVGLVDTGIEADHPAFVGRILRLWDQTLPGPGVSEGGYGTELPADMRHLSTDTDGHGTHVAGIAAGDDPTYGGVAPGADLVIVKSDLLDAHLADGLRYVFRVATDLGRPAVVVLTAGGVGDAHDGTDPLSQVVDAESGPGRIVCCSAGNDGNGSVHAALDLAPGECATVPCSVPRPAAEEAAPAAGLTGWYAGADELAVAVTSPTGASTPFQPVLIDGPPARTYELPGGMVGVVTPGPDPANGDHRFLVEVSPSTSAPPATTTWGLRLRGERVTVGHVDVWSVDGEAAQLRGGYVRDSMKIGSPAAASSAVTVGAFTTKVEWFNVLGHPHQAGFSLDDVSDFSSEGPLRDGTDKPDLVAPGAMIGASLSGESPFDLQYLVDDLNTVRAGTSAAAAFVAGLVALLLEADPTLGPGEVKERLRAHCTVPGRAPGTFDPKWGFGLVDAERLCKASGSRS